MKLSQKDKSLILFITALIIVLWGIFSAFFLITKKTASSNPDFKRVIATDKNNWYNVSRKLDGDLLKDKIVVLDFWNHNCFKCLSHVNKIKQIISKYNQKVVFIGIHSPFTEHEDNDVAVGKVITKYNISYPVINDQDRSLYNHFGVKAWPTYFVIDPKGKIHNYIDNISKLEDLIENIAHKFRFRLSDSSLPLMPVRDFVIDNVMQNPTKIVFTQNYIHEGKEIPALIIANSGKNTVLVTNLAGKILQKIGSGAAGFEDGNLNTASFNNPTSILYRQNRIYVADSGNNALRLADLKNNQVLTIIGSGNVGPIIDSNKSYSIEDFDLAYPVDIEFFPDDNNIVIANSAANQILSYNIALKKIRLIAGNGQIGMDDNSNAKDGSLAQTADLFPFSDKLYFVDSKSAALRYINGNGELKTLIGQGVGKFGFKDGGKSNALMHRPMSLDVDESGIYIVDSYNNSIRRYNFKTSELLTVIKSLEIDDSSASNLDQPAHLISVFDKFYISDTYNNRVLSVNRITLKPRIFDVMPQQKIYQDLVLEYKPVSNNEVTLKSGGVNIVTIKIEDGWKINNLGPSYLSLLKIGKDEAELIDYFNWNDIQNSEIEINNLDSHSKYALSGKIYYCEDKQNSLCFIKNYDTGIIAKTNSKNNLIIIEIGN